MCVESCGSLSCDSRLLGSPCHVYGTSFVIAGAPVERCVAGWIPCHVYQATIHITATPVEQAVAWCFGIVTDCFQV